MSLPLDVELKVVDGDVDVLACLHGERPRALGVHVVLAGVVGTRDISVIHDHRGVRRARVVYIVTYKENPVYALSCLDVLQNI